MVVKTKLHSQIVVIIFVFLLCQSCNENSATNGQKGIVYDPKVREYIYSPTGCLFQIGFPSKPEIRDVRRSTNPHNISMEVANLTIEEDSTVLSVNFELYDSEFNSSAKDKLLSMIKNEAVLKGLANASVNYSPDSIGERYTIHGSKLVNTDDPKKDIEMIYDDSWYFKGTNLFCISIICPADKYPTKSVNKFIASLKLAK